MTITSPIMSPTKISGSFSTMEFIPNEISGMEVKSPRTKNESANEEMRSFRANVSMDETMRPDPNQIKTNDRRYRKIFIIIFHSV